jgi:hypothetical protein
MFRCKKKVLLRPHEDAGPEHCDPRQTHAVRRHAVRLGSLAPPSAHEGSEGQLQRPLQEWITSKTFFTNGTREKKISCSFFNRNRRSQTPTDFSSIYVKKIKTKLHRITGKNKKKKESREVKCYLAMLPCLMPIFSLSFDKNGKFWFESFLAFPNLDPQG